LLTGIKPLDAVIRAAALAESKPDPLKPADEIYAAVGPEIAAILRLAMAVNPEDRYQSASDFREALRRLGRSGPKTEIVNANHDSTINPTIVKDKRAVPIDPFGRYSILKPDETAWVVRKSSSRLRTIVAVMIVTIA